MDEVAGSALWVICAALAMSGPGQIETRRSGGGCLILPVDRPAFRDAVLRPRETAATPLAPAVLPACGRRPHHRTQAMFPSRCAARCSGFLYAGFVWGHPGGIGPPAEPGVTPMNSVFLSGRITSDITRFGTDSKGGASFTLVTSRPVIKDGQVVKGEDGYPETYDQFHTIKAFNGLGKTVANHKKKGDKLIVHGEIRYSRNEKDGRTYYNTEIVADEIEFL
jgi:single-strand DNA-binding protein